MTDEDVNSTKSDEILPSNDWDYPNFKHFLTSSVSLLPIEKRFPAKINTGAIGDSLQEMVNQTKTDPQHRERARALKLGLGNEILLQNNPVIGDDKHVVTMLGILTSTNTINPQYSKTEDFLGILHTHPHDITASFQDRSYLLTPQEKGGTVLQMVGTPEINLMFLRTLKSDDNSLSSDRIQDWIKLESESFDNTTLFMSKSERSMALNRRIGEICKEHNIAVYSNLGGNVYIKASLI